MEGYAAFFVKNDEDAAYTFVSELGDRPVDLVVHQTHVICPIVDRGAAWLAQVLDQTPGGQATWFVHNTDRVDEQVLEGDHREPTGHVALGDGLLDEI
jgi:hypothetical protein